MNDTNTDGTCQMRCPHCGHEEEESFDTEKNLTGQDVFVCPSCDEAF